MDTPIPPLPSRRPRPHRINVNIDDETLQTLRALAYAGGTSMSSTAADALMLLLPVLRPAVESMEKLRTAPVEAMERLSLHAEHVAALADGAVREIRALRGLAPPSSNTGG